MDEQRRAALENIVEDFCNRLFGPENIDNILYVWGKFPPLHSTGVIPALESIISTVLFKPIELVVHPSYLELFRGEVAIFSLVNCSSIHTKVTLRLPRSILSKTIINYVSFFEKDEYWALFFGANRTDGMCTILSKFKHNERLVKAVDRRKIFNNIVFKLLMVSLEVEEGCYYSDVLECINAAMKNICFINGSLKQNVDEGSILEKENKRYILETLEQLQNPSLYDILQKQRTIRKQQCQIQKRAKESAATL